MSFLRPLDEQKAIQEFEEWHKSMLKLQSLVQNGNWENDTSKQLAQLLCKDVIERVEKCISRLSLSENKKHQLENSNITVSASFTGVDKTIMISEKKLRLEDSNKRIIKQITTSEVNDGHQWKKHGRKETKGCSHPRDYYKCGQKDCTGKKHVQQISVANPPIFQVTYYDDHNCKAFSLPFGDVIESQKRTGLGLINETQQPHLNSPELVQDDMNIDDPYVAIMNESQEHVGLRPAEAIVDKIKLVKEQEQENVGWYADPPNVQDSFIADSLDCSSILGKQEQRDFGCIPHMNELHTDYGSSSGYASSCVSSSTFGQQSAYGNLSINSAASSKADMDLPGDGDISGDWDFWRDPN